MGFLPHQQLDEHCTRGANYAYSYYPYHGCNAAMVLSQDRFSYYHYKGSYQTHDRSIEQASGKKDRKGKRQYLSDVKTREMLKRLNQYLEGMVDVPRIRIGKRQTIETLINEEALLLAKFLRDERKSWTPRIAIDRSIVWGYRFYPPHTHTLSRLLVPTRFQEK